MIKEISSKHNPLYRELKSLTESKGLKESSDFLLSGEKLVHEFVRSSSRLKVKYEIRTNEMPPVSVHTNLVLAQDLFDEIDTLGTHSSILVVEQPQVYNLKDLHALSGWQLVAPLQDPGNLGSIARSAEAFGIKRILLTDSSCHPFLPKVVKASSGSVYRLNWGRLTKEEHLSFYKDSKSVALDLDGIELSKFQWPKSGTILCGLEGPGHPLKALTRVSIRTTGVESLNAVVASSIAMFHLSLIKN